MSEQVQTSEPKEFLGNAGSLRTTIWIAKDDFEPGQKLVLTIARVVKFKTVVWPGGRAGHDVPAVQFSGTDRCKHLDAESRNSLIAAFGNQTGDWKGKQVVVFVKSGIKGGDNSGKGVRILPHVTGDEN